MSDSKDYHDYVFKDGKFVGEFDSMYRNSNTIPWHQDEQADWIDVRLSKGLISDKNCFEKVIDLGCGTGHYLDLICDSFLASGGIAYGFDISETACQQAKSIFPQYRFDSLDLLSTDLAHPDQLSEALSPSLFMIRGTLWYLVSDLPLVIYNIRKMMKSNDYLLVVQNFPPLESEFVGKKEMSDYKALIGYFSSQFKLERHVWYVDASKNVNDNWFIHCE